MKNILFILSISSAVLFASCKKDSNSKPSVPPPSDTLGVGWEKVNSADTAGILDIFFVNSTGFFLGTNVYKSTDGGEDWSAVTHTGFSTFSFINLAMGSEMNAIFVTPNNRLAITHDGGAGFTSKLLQDNFLTDVFFVNANVAYAAGDHIWKTIDGGDNWVSLHDFGPSGGWNSLSFTGEQTGWVMKANGVYKTTNGGVGWQKSNTDTINLLMGGAIFSLNSDTCYFTNTHSLYKTVDGGASWTKSFNFTSEWYHDIHFVSANVGYISDGRFVFKTTDGGNSWAKVIAMASCRLMELHFTDANHGWVSGEKGTVLKFTQ